MFMFKMQNMTAKDPFLFNRDPQSGIVFGMSQQLPLWGKLGLREKMEKEESESYRWTSEEKKTRPGPFGQGNILQALGGGQGAGRDR